MTDDFKSVLEEIERSKGLSPKDASELTFENREIVPFYGIRFEFRSAAGSSDSEIKLLELAIYPERGRFRTEYLERIADCISGLPTPKSRTIYVNTDPQDVIGRIRVVVYIEQEVLSESKELFKLQVSPGGIRTVCEDSPGLPISTEIKLEKLAEELGKELGKYMI